MRSGRRLRFGGCGQLLGSAEKEISHKGAKVQRNRRVEKTKSDELAHCGEFSYAMVLCVSG